MRSSKTFMLPDVQSYAEDRNLPIDGVGVRGVRHPVAVRTAEGGVIPTVATLTLSVAPFARIEHPAEEVSAGRSEANRTFGEAHHAAA